LNFFDSFKLSAWSRTSNRLNRFFFSLFLIFVVFGPEPQIYGYTGAVKSLDVRFSGGDFLQTLMRGNFSGSEAPAFFRQNAPNLNFVGLQHYARVSGQVAFQIQASDDVGVTRVEFYVDGKLIGAANVNPSSQNVTLPFAWDTANLVNGKHIAQARVYDVEGNAETGTVVVITRNFSASRPLPSAAFSAAPATIQSGQSTVLSWSTTGADTVTINQGIGAVAASGTRTVSLTATTTYTLTATNTAGSVTKTATVTVASVTGSTIDLRPAVTYQTMTGWEATSQAGQFDSPAWNSYKNALLDQAVGDLGLNRIRLEIKSGNENPVDYFAQWRAGQITESEYKAKRYEIINDNSDPRSVNANGFKWSQIDHTIDNIVLPMKQRLEARGESLWISVDYVDFGASSFEHKNNPQEYAEFVLATYQHIRSKYGFTPNSWEVILEPDTSTAGWSAVQVAQAIKAAGDLLKANNITPNFVAPSTTNASNTPVYIDQIAALTGAMTYVGEFAYHRYCCANTTVLQNIASRAVQYNKNVGMLEWIGADYNTLHQDLKLGRNSSWQQFTLAFPDVGDNGAQYYTINDTNPSNPVITMGSRTKFLRQYFKFIRSGAKRIEALSGDAAFDPLAFINQNGKYVVVVKASAGGTFNVKGLPAGTYGIKYTTASQYDTDRPDVTISGGQNLPANIPAAGVITVYAR
jgi:hypothetical protein